MRPSIESKLTPLAVFLVTTSIPLCFPARSAEISTAGYLAGSKYCELRELGYTDRQAWVQAVSEIERSSTWGRYVTADQSRSRLFGDKARAQIRQQCPELLPRYIR